MDRLRPAVLTCLAALGLLSAACSSFGSSFSSRSPSGLAQRAPEELHEIVPPSYSTYASDPLLAPQPEGVAAVVDRTVVRLLSERGDTFRADGRLVQLATWVATRDEVPADGSVLDAMSHRVGHAGPTLWLVFVRDSNVTEALIEGAMRRQLEAVPRNFPITRYGVGTARIAAGGGGDIVAIAFGPVELELDPVPKQVARNEALHLRGVVGDRFTRSTVAITRPDGTVRTFESRSRSFAMDYVVTDVGLYRVELFGQGSSGPVVVANLPVYVDVHEPDPPARTPATSQESATALTPALADQRMLTLLAEARAEAHLPSLIEDEELSALARSHSEDMGDHGFFGHVSPTTGTTEERFRRAKLLLPLYGENVAQGDSPEMAHRVLMDSPGHRANMLDGRFTHVGIGSVVRPDAFGHRMLTVTLTFGRRPTSIPRRSGK
ncbi:CAP domain-containing protein [Pendulispora brunnea]|uniref:CAP domain-containing protein n=1 Tax=Pendulispora brunnea TaxID=2905690 RepID=A0ABZ2K166_9BACT